MLYQVEIVSFLATAGGVKSGLSEHMDGTSPSFCFHEALSPCLVPKLPTMLSSLQLHITDHTFLAPNQQLESYLEGEPREFKTDSQKANGNREMFSKSPKAYSVRVKLGFNQDTTNQKTSRIH